MNYVCACCLPLSRNIRLYRWYIETYSENRQKNALQGAPQIWPDDADADQPSSAQPYKNKPCKHFANFMFFTSSSNTSTNVINAFVAQQLMLAFDELTSCLMSFWTHFTNKMVFFRFYKNSIELRHEM